MPKENTNVSLDSELKRKAKEKGIVISEFLERKLKQELYGYDKKDLPEETLRLKCSKCGKIVEKGFYCELKQKFFCEKCNLTRIKLSSGVISEIFSCKCSEEHEHIAVPGNDNIRKELVNKIKENQRR